MQQGGMGQEEMGGEGREAPLEMPACSNKARSREPWAEVCCWEVAACGCPAEHKELLVGLLVACPQVLQVRLCFPVLTT